MTATRLRSILAASLFPLAFAAINGCSSASEDDVALADGAGEEVKAGDPILGAYEGTGIFPALELVRASNGKQTFTAKQQVQCITAPCPAAPLDGTWGVRKGNTLRLTVSGGSVLSYGYTLSADGRTLVLSNDGNQVAKLTKKGGSSNGSLATTLAKHGVPNLTIEVDPNESAAQATAHPGSVTFEAAVDRALTAYFSSTGDGPIELTKNAIENEWVSGACAGISDAKKATVCLVNNAGSTLNILPRGESSPQGDEIEQNWVFALWIADEGWGDHGVYAVVPRDGSPAWTFTFN